MIGDIIESANVVIRRPRTASVVLGGGTPKNFINQASVQAEFFNPRVKGHRYAIQIVTDVEALRYHYALTLAEWYRRTVAAKEEN